MNCRLFAALSLGLVLVGCGAASVGKSCGDHYSCGGLENGYCSRAGICTRECSSSYACPSDATCVDAGRSACLPKCTGDGGCVKGLRCAKEGYCVVEYPLGKRP